MSAYHPGGLPGQLGPARPPLPGLYPDPGWATQSYVGPPHTVCRAPASPPALSLHPSAEFSVEVVGPPAVAAPVPPVGPSAPAAPVVPPGDSAQSPVSTRPSQSGSEDEDESVHMQRLSVMETELRLGQRDMVRVLQLPSLGETAGSSRQSFKRMTSSAASSTPVFSSTAARLGVCWAHEFHCRDGKVSPYKKRELSYYRFPTDDFTQFFTAPVVPDSAKDKLAADGGSSSAKNLFSDRSRGKLEDTLKKVDTASRLGLRASSFLLLLTEYLALGCEEDSPIPADLFTAALHCLDHGLRTSLDQFSRISTLEVTARRANVLDALFLPSEGARKRLQALPLLGPDLFAGKFQKSMEAEAKRLEATEKINLNKPSQPAPKSARKVDKATFKIPRSWWFSGSTAPARPWLTHTGPPLFRGLAQVTRSACGGLPSTDPWGAASATLAGPGLDSRPIGGCSKPSAAVTRWNLRAPPVGHVRSSDSHPVGRIETPHSRGGAKVSPLQTRRAPGPSRGGAGGIYVHLFSGSQKRGGRVAAHTESTAPQPIHPAAPFPDADFKDDSRVHLPPGLGGEFGLAGCLSPCPNSSGTPEVPPFPVRQRHVRVCRSPLRSFHLPQGVHPGGGSDREVTAATGDLGVHVLGRLDCRGPPSLVDVLRQPHEGPVFSAPAIVGDHHDGCIAVRMGGQSAPTAGGWGYGRPISSLSISMCWRCWRCRWPSGVSSVRFPTRRSAYGATTPLSWPISTARGEHARGNCAPWRGTFSTGAFATTSPCQRFTSRAWTIRWPTPCLGGGLSPQSGPFSPRRYNWSSTWSTVLTWTCLRPRTTTSSRFIVRGFTTPMPGG